MKGGECPLKPSNLLTFYLMVLIHEPVPPLLSIPWFHSRCSGMKNLGLNSAYSKIKNIAIVIYGISNELEIHV